MKVSQWFQVAILATASCFTVGALSPTFAATFDSTEVNADKFIAVAAPFGNNQHQLLILEQLSNQRPCWRESGSNPVMVEPLLLSFDFSGICGRSTDSNGYSIRMNDQDLGLDYILRIVERNGELLLVGSPRGSRRASEIVLGSTKGNGSGFKKIFLNPGWRFTRRAYQGKPLGHIYITTDSSAPPVASGSNPEPVRPSQPLPSRPLPSSVPPLPAPERELIFTKPGVDSTAPSRVVPTVPRSPSPSNSDRQIPVFVVPTE
jgi:N-acetylmuramoyl-L-alanine amidase